MVVYVHNTFAGLHIHTVYSFCFCLTNFSKICPKVYIHVSQTNSERECKTEEQTNKTKKLYKTNK